MPPAAAAAQDDEDEQKMGSEPSLWLPLTVVRRHRKKATVIWVSLIVAFIAYISFIVWDTVKSRRDPAASYQIKQEVFSFPDVAICLGLYQGCLTANIPDCLENSFFTMVNQWGFMNTTLEVDDASLAIEEAFPACKVLPASKLQLNQTGIDNGDITYLTASFTLYWYEDLFGEYDPSDPDTSIFYTQFVNLFFLNVDDGVEAIGEEIADAKLPYENIVPATGEIFTTTTSHMVLALEEYEPISSSTGKKRTTQRTFTQSTTTGKTNWYWDATGYNLSASSLFFDLFIPKFEYTSIEEVDPVDAWAIIGAIGGVWQFVVIGFGLFFVYSEKQPPDKKMRNFRKTVVKPASIVTKRLSSVSSRGSTTSQDVVVDSSDEDLPVEWVKKQRKDGSFYYCNTMTGVVQDDSPNERGAAATSAPAATRPRRGIARMFKPAHKGSTGTHDEHELEFSGVNLPPGWRARKDGAGKTYYVNAVLKTTQWERPRQRAASAAGSSVQAVDAPMAHSYRSPGSSVQSSTVHSFGNHNHSGGGDSTGGVGDPAPPYGSTSAASSAPAKNDSPPSSVSKAPSYRTMMSLPSSSEEASAKPPSAAATTFATTGGGAGGGGGSSSLPEGWHRRTTADGKTYYANAATKVTQWRAPKA